MIVIIVGIVAVVMIAKVVEIVRELCSYLCTATS